MKLVVCIKQVPDAAGVRIDPHTHTLRREGVPALVNPFDLPAIEEALRLRDATGGHLTVLTMGPRQAEAALRETLSRGADEGILLSDRAFAGGDTWATGLVLAAAIRRLGGADVIVCGRQATDGDTAQVGPGLAAHLDLPALTYVSQLVSWDAASVTAERQLDDGVETVRVQRPCVLCVGRQIHPARFPSLAGLLRARHARLTHWGAAELGLDAGRTGLKGSPTRVVRIFAPETHARCAPFSGTPEACADRLVEWLGAAQVLPS